MTSEDKQKAAAKLLKKICRKVGVTLRDHEMLEADDHILIGLSGGKDSMILAEVMAERRAALPFDFKISAAHIDITNIAYETDKQELEQFCKKLNIEFHYMPSEITIDPDSKKGVCFACSWSRRKSLFHLARDLKCNKLALGHHRNDAVETLLMNMIYHGSISSMPYTLSMFDGELNLLRPLLDMPENLLEEYASLRAYKFEKAVCPHAGENKRDSVRDLMKQVDQLHGKGTYHIFRSMDKIFDEYLPRESVKG